MRIILSARRLLAAIALVGLVAARITLPAMAQEQSAGSGLQISPTRHEISVPAGTEKTITTSLKNVSGAKIVAKAIINDFEADNETGNPKLKTETNEVSAASIQRFITNLQDVPLEKDEVKEVALTVSVPDNATPGAYYGVVRYQAIPDSAEDDGNVSLTASVGTIVLLEVPGDIRESMEILSISAQKNDKRGTFFTSAPDTLAIEIRNTGNSFLKPFGRVSVEKGGKEIYSYELNNTDPRGNILPDSIRTFKDEIRGMKGFGKFTATANIGFGNGGEVLTVSASFWIVPLWTMFALGGVVLVLLVGIIYLGIKIRSRRHGFKKRR